MKIRSKICENDGFTYRYDLNLEEDGIGNVYSVEIKMESADGKINSKIKRELYSDTERAYKLFNTLVENLATPINLRFILEDEK